MMKITIKADVKPSQKAMKKALLSMWKIMGWKRFFVADWWGTNENKEVELERGAAKIPLERLVM